MNTTVYDAAGRMTQHVNSIDGEVDYTHDDTNQLTDADYDYRTDESYTYDSNGNRTNTGYVTGPNNQLLSYGVFRYEYDAEGNRTLRYVDSDSSETLNSGDIEITEYEWDYRNRLTKVEYFTTYAYYDSGTSDQIVEYTYDYANRLIKRVLDPDGTSGATSVEQSVYVYEAGQIVAQFDKTGTGDLAATDLSHRYLWNPQAVDQLFADEQVHWDAQEEEFITDELLWALTDHQNSIRDLAVYDSGLDETAIALHRALDSFGNVALSCGSAECLFDYTGKLFDEATQTQYNLNNWYDALVGRWLSEDKAQSRSNLTCYCSNNPLTNTDPNGLVGTPITSDAQRQQLHDCAKKELDALVQAGKITQQEANMRLAIIDAAINSNVGYDSSQNAWRNPNYWEIKGVYQVKPGVSPCEAIKNMVYETNPSKPGGGMTPFGGTTGCRKACQLVILAGICDYCKSIGKHGLRIDFLT